MKNSEKKNNVFYILALVIVLFHCVNVTVDLLVLCIDCLSLSLVSYRTPPCVTCCT